MMAENKKKNAAAAIECAEAAVTDHPYSETYLRWHTTLLHFAGFNDLEGYARPLKIDP